jgi:cytochrome c-type biogenesis protein CcmH
MAIWMLLAMMTAVAVLAVLWPLARHREVTTAPDPNTQFYRDQLAEIERDRERGLLSATEVEAARAEAGRRFLRASAASEPATAALGEPALRRRRAVSALVLSVVPILALAMYGAFGSPHLSGLPLAERLRAGSDMDLATAVARIESHLAANPQDGRGWEVIAPVYLRMGRMEDAAKAFENALRLLGPDTDRLTNYGEAVVAAKEGVVPSEARVAFEKALALDASQPKARFYLARAAEQDGNIDKAKAEYETLLASAPGDAPWKSLVKDELARLNGADDGNVPGRENIAGMVEGLAARLEAQGGNVEEWSRLIRSYVVLGEPAKAKAAAGRAREALARDPGAMQRLDAVATELKLADK